MNKNDGNALNASISSLSKESTVQLVRRIVESSDRLALKVLMDDRKLFLVQGEAPLCFSEFLKRIRYTLISHEKIDAVEYELADCAYDLTVAKYTNFPDPQNKVPHSDFQYLKRGVRVDCRNYYRAFLCLMEKQIGTGDFVSQAKEESVAGRILNRLVWKAFSFSQKECKRISPFSVRYSCEVNGKNITLWYPSHMTSKEFKHWLEAHLQNIDPDELNKKDYLQSIIDNELIRGHHVQLDGHEANFNRWGDDASSLLEINEGFAAVGSLADAVAEEKTKNINKLRRSIKALGPKTLKRLICQIFSDLSTGEYEASLLADQYQISRPTFSRFAGSKWLERLEDNNKASSEKKGNKSIKIPDLWRNTAQILRKSDAFMETVISSGTAVRLEEVLDLMNREKG